MNREHIKLTRSQGGTEERVVILKDIIIPTVPDLTESNLDEYWVHSAWQLRELVEQLTMELQAGCGPSIDLFIPNYWKAVTDLGDEYSLPLLELWHLAHDIGKEFMLSNPTSFSVTQNGIAGHLYLPRPKNS